MGASSTNDKGPGAAQATQGAGFAQDSPGGAEAGCGRGQAAAAAADVGGERPGMDGGMGADTAQDRVPVPGRVLGRAPGPGRAGGGLRDPGAEPDPGPAGGILALRQHGEAGQDARGEARLAGPGMDGSFSPATGSGDQIGLCNARGPARNPTI